MRALSRRSARERTGRFLVDGPQGVREALRYAADRVVGLYVTPAAAQRHAALVAEATAGGVRVHPTADPVMAAIAESEHPQGLLAVVTAERHSLREVLARAPRLLVLLVAVRDPGNAGTVIRAADAAGADAVLLGAASVDVTSPKAVRASAGSLFHLPVVSGLDVEATLAALRAHGIRSLAADGSGSTVLGDADLSSPHAWVLGNEAWGLPAEVRVACDEVVRVPLLGRAESLNLAMAATVCLYASAGVLGRRAGDPPRS